VSSLSGTSLEGSVEAIPHRIFVVYGGVLQYEILLPKHVDLMTRFFAEKKLRIISIYVL